MMNTSIISSRSFTTQHNLSSSSTAPPPLDSSHQQVGRYPSLLTSTQVQCEFNLTPKGILSVRSQDPVRGALDEFGTATDGSLLQITLDAERRVLEERQRVRAFREGVKERLDAERMKKEAAAHKRAMVLKERENRMIEVAKAQCDKWYEIEQEDLAKRFMKRASPKRQANKTAKPYLPQPHPELEHQVNLLDASVREARDALLSHTVDGEAQPSLAMWSSIHETSEQSIVEQPQQQQQKTSYRSRAAMQQTNFSSEEFKKMHLLRRKVEMDLERDNTRKLLLLRQKWEKAERERQRQEAEAKQLEQERRLVEAKALEMQKEADAIAQEESEMMQRAARERDATQHVRDKQQMRVTRALTAELKKQLKERRMQVPPLCNCGVAADGSYEDHCARNCQFYDGWFLSQHSHCADPQGYTRALSNLIASLR